MTYTGSSADGGGGMFPQHPRSGDWETLKGRMLAPHICEPMQSTAHTSVRSAPAGKTDWTGSILVNTGMTQGGGTMAAK